MLNAAKIGVVAALAREARCFRQAGDPDSLLVCVSGVGASSAQQAAVHLLKGGANLLISWGTAGGLAPALSSGTLLLPERILNRQGRIFEVDAHWRGRLQADYPADLPLVGGDLLQVDTLVTEVHQKQQLFAQYQANAVDMESAAVAEAAQQAGVPFLAVRSIVDPADFVLPAWLPPLLTANGRIKIGSLLKQLCTAPSRLRPLLQLSSHFTAAKTTLKRVDIPWK
jgi:adenosylhomocysteine nucleosidase